MKWQSMETSPKEGDFLVELETPMAGSVFHVMHRMKIRNGILAAIGGNFEFDCPKPIRWTPIIPHKD